MPPYYAILNILASNYILSYGGRLLLISKGISNAFQNQLEVVTTIEIATIIEIVADIVMYIALGNGYAPFFKIKS